MRFISRVENRSSPLALAFKIFRGYSRKMKIKAALIDLSGTLHVEDDPTPGALTALERLRTANIVARFVTNTTKESTGTLYKRLQNIGFNLERNEIFSSLTAASNYVKNEKLNPFYLLTEDARQDFIPIDNSRDFDAVVVGLAPEEFSYENLNKAFNILISNSNNRLIAVHQGKYYKRSDGLALGPGFFVKGLEYATCTSALTIGKPNSRFFQAAIPEGIKPEECVMIGDDLDDDIIGAMKLGLKGILVKTGKYRESYLDNTPPTALVENFSKAVDWVIEKNLSLV